MNGIQLLSIQELTTKWEKQTSKQSFIPSDECHDRAGKRHVPGVGILKREKRKKSIPGTGNNNICKDEED